MVQLFSCEFCKIYKNTFFTEHVWTTASISYSYHIHLRSSRLQRFFKIGVRKNFAILTGKHLRWCLFLIKLLDLRPTILLKRDSTQMFSYKYWEILKNSFFHRTPLVAASNSYKLPLSLRNGEILRPLAGKVYYKYHFKKNKIRSFRNTILVPIILRKIIPEMMTCSKLYITKLKYSKSFHIQTKGKRKTSVSFPVILCK